MSRADTTKVTLCALHYRGNITFMTIATSRLTAQGQISVPAAVRRRLGIDPGAVLEWSEVNGEIVVRRAGRFSSEDIHRALFGDRVVTRKDAREMKEGIRRHIRKRHARG